MVANISVISIVWLAALVAAAQAVVPRHLPHTPSTGTTWKPCPPEFDNRFLARNCLPDRESKISFPIFMECTYEKQKKVIEIAWSHWNHCKSLPLLTVGDGGLCKTNLQCVTENSECALDLSAKSVEGKQCHCKPHHSLSFDEDRCLPNVKESEHCDESSQCHAFCGEEAACIEGRCVGGQCSRGSANNPFSLAGILGFVIGALA